MATEKNTVIDGKTNQSFAVTNDTVVGKETPPYAKPQKPKLNKEKNYKAAEKFAPNREKPTTADAKKGLLNLPAAMSAVDPQGLSSIAPMMYSMLGQIAASSSGSSQSSRKRIIEDALSGALALLSNKYTFQYLTLVFDAALANNAIQLIDSDYRETVKNALANLYKNYTSYGENIPTNTVDVVVTIGIPQTPLVTVVPDFYVQQYYSKSTDPYPGYIKWISPDSTDYVFTERTIGDPYYTTPEEEVYTEAEQQLAISLEPYVIENNLTAPILNDLILQQDQDIQNGTQEKTGGKNSAKQLFDILSQLAGYAGTISNTQQSTQLPNSVLNQSSIQSSLSSFMSNVGQLRQEKEKAKQGSQPATAISSMISAIGSGAQFAGSAKSLYDKIKG